VEYDIRRHQRSIDTFEQRSEQSTEEATAVLRKFREAQAFRRTVLESLTCDS
jgi:hypothetical protein